MIFELVASIEAVTAPAKTSNSWAPEDLVVVLLHVTLKLIVALERCSCGAPNNRAIQVG